jgi:hypothetical protein
MHGTEFSGIICKERTGLDRSEVSTAQAKTQKSYAHSSLTYNVFGPFHRSPFIGGS